MQDVFIYLAVIAIGACLSYAWWKFFAWFHPLTNKWTGFDDDNAGGE